VKQPLVARRADSDRHRRVAVELDPRDPDEVVAARSKRLGDDHQDVVLDGDVRPGDSPVAPGDGEVAAVDGIHAELSRPCLGGLGKRRVTHTAAGGAGPCV